MTDPGSDRERAAPDADLVEYVLATVPDPDALAGLGSALARLVDRGTIRILDLVVLVRAGDTIVSSLELEQVESLVALGRLDGRIAGLLSRHDVELAAAALGPDAAAMLLLVEDRWAAPLAAAARAAGGQVIGGERIARPRLLAALAEPAEPGEPGEPNGPAGPEGPDGPDGGEGPDGPAPGPWRSRGPGYNLLARKPAGSGRSADSALAVDPVAQLRELTRLVDRGLLTLEQFEVQRRRVLDD